jgi:uncharacterized protein (DUF1697 family)
VPRAIAAFLKGVNVGGNKKIDMKGLRLAVAEAGCGDVRTYLQSGNVVFTCDRKDLKGVASDIEEPIEKAYGFTSRVILREARALSAAIDADPLADVATNPSRHLIGFLAEGAAPKAVQAAEAASTDRDLVAVVGKHLYMWCPEGISASPLFRINFDRVLGTTVTMRNWTTAAKVAQMLGELRR